MERTYEYHTLERTHVHRIYPVREILFKVAKNNILILIVTQANCILP